MLEPVTTSGGMRVPQEEVPVVTALLLVEDGVSPTELAAKFSAVCWVAQERTRAALRLSRLADLGLVRMTRQDREPQYVLTGLGEQHAQATLAGRADLAGGLAALEQLRTDLLSTVAR